MKILFELAPLSQNNIERTGGKTSIRYKTQAAKRYREAIHIYMKKESARVRKFISKVDLNKHVFAVEFHWFFNEDRFFKKQRPKKNPFPLSSRCEDYDNPIKFTQDCIFKYLGIDDTFIVNGLQRKRPTKRESFFICRISLLEKAALFHEF